MSGTARKQKSAPEGYRPNKPEILKLAEKHLGEWELPESALIPFSGSVVGGSPRLVPHTRAFASAVMSLRALFGLPLNTKISEDVNFRDDFDYYNHLLISGEGFLFWQDVWNYLLEELPQRGRGPDTWEGKDCSLPKDAQPLLDSFAFEGIEAELCSLFPAKGVSKTLGSAPELKEVVLKNLSRGFPALLFSGCPGDRILLATGYEQGGSVLNCWKFSAGDDKANRTFDSEKCKPLKNWQKNIFSVLLIKSPPKPVTNKNEILLRALRCGADLILKDNNLDNFTKYLYSAGEPKIYPEIWDLAERRHFLSVELERVSKILNTEALAASVSASEKIHANMWRIHKLYNDADKNILHCKKEIADIIKECRELDLSVASNITLFLDDLPESYRPKTPKIIEIMKNMKKNEILIDHVSELCSVVDRDEINLVGISVPVNFESQGYPTVESGFEGINDAFIARKYITDGTVKFLANALGINLDESGIVSARFDAESDGNYKTVIGFPVEDITALPEFLPEHTVTLHISASRYAKMEINEDKKDSRPGFSERMHADEYFIGEFREKTGYVYDLNGNPMNTWNPSGEILAKYEPIRPKADDSDIFDTFTLTPVLLPPLKIACCSRPHGDNEGECISDYFKIATQVYSTGLSRYYQNGDFYGFPIDTKNSYKSCFGSRVSSFEGLPEGVEKIILPGGEYIHITQKEFNGDNPSMPYDIAFNHMDKLYFSSHPQYEWDTNRKVIARFRQANCASAFVPVKKKLM